MLHVTLIKEHEAILQVYRNNVNIHIILNSKAKCSYRIIQQQVKNNIIEEVDVTKPSVSRMYVHKQRQL